MCTIKAGAATAVASAEESWIDKPVANIVVSNNTVICGKFKTATCGSKHNSKSLCAAPTKKLLVFWTHTQNKECNGNEWTLLTLQVGYERRLI